jgi:hypothetical protein
MFDRHRLAYAALAVVYAASTMIMFLDGILLEAVCSFFAALIYAAMYNFQSDTLPQPDSESS